MKKQKLKNLLKIGILSFGIFLLLWNCQKDETLEHNHESIKNNTSEFSRVSINDLIQTDNTFSELSNTYIPTTLKSKNASAKTNSSNLIITSDTINVVEKENYKSYTLRIKRDGHEFDTENLIIEQNNGSKNAYILSYDFDNDYVVDLINGVHSTPKGTVYYSEFDTSNLSSKTSTAKSSGSCQYLTITITAPCPCEGHYTSCSCYQQATSYTHTELICGESSGGDGFDLGGPLPTNDGDGSGGDGGPAPTDDNSSNTSTNLEDMSEFVEFKINNLITRLELNTNQAKWVGQNIQESLEIYDFVSQKRWKNDANEFAKSAIEALINDGEVDFDDNVILSKEFKDNAKLKCVYDKLAGDNNTLFRDTVGAFIDNPNVNLIFTIGDCQGAAGACTQDQYVEETGIITIKIENINETPIEIAQMIIHEAIHAELAKYVLEHDSTVDTNDKPRLFELYKFYRESGVPEKHIDHPYMALNYINPIASALRQFDNNKYPIDYYKSLAWIGLEDFDVNAVLTNPLINTYNQYLSTIIQNSTICN